MNTMSSFINSLLFVSIISISSVLGSDDTVRRLLSDDTPSHNPTLRPTHSPISNCIISRSLDETPNANPSDIDMGVVTATSGKHEIDLDISVSLNADLAAAFCVSKFGAGSVPVTPTTPQRYEAMVNLCESLGNGQTCYMGLFREDYDGDRSDCKTFRGEHATFNIQDSELVSTYGGIWSGSGPTCLWNGDIHCLAYKTTSNKIKVENCGDQMNVICEFNGSCSA